MSLRADISYDTFQSPLGQLVLVFSGKGLAQIRFEGEEKPPYPRGKAPAQFRKQLNDYFDGTLREFHQPLLFLSGTDFEKKVWLSLTEVPYGETRTYKWLAERIGNAKAVRAVGHALGSNPIPIALPCHRIIGSDGSLVGYTGGLDVKRRLLDLEYYYLIGRK